MRKRLTLKKVAFGDLKVENGKIKSLMIYEKIHKEDGTLAAVCHAYREVDIPDEFDEEQYA